MLLEELLPLVEMLDLLLEELLPLVEMLDLLEALDEDICSIERIWSLSPLFGPGNCKSPVWKFNTSGVLFSPVVR